MKEQEAITLYDANDLKEIIIQPSAEKNGWILKLVTENGIEYTLISTGSENSPRIFETVDACVHCCKKIGINNVTLVT